MSIKTDIELYSYTLKIEGLIDSINPNKIWWFISPLQKLRVIS